MMARLKELEDENRRLKKMYAEERLKAGILQEAMAKKVVTPSRRREMAHKAVTERGVSIRLACAAFAISETCYRYQPRLSVSIRPGPRTLRFRFVCHDAVEQCCSAGRVRLAQVDHDIPVHRSPRRGCEVERSKDGLCDTALDVVGAAGFSPYIFGHVAATYTTYAIPPH